MPNEGALLALVKVDAVNFEPPEARHRIFYDNPPYPQERSSWKRRLSAG